MSQHCLSCGFIIQLFLCKYSSLCYNSSVLLYWCGQVKGNNFFGKGRPFTRPWVEGSLRVFREIVTNPTLVDVIKWICNIKNGGNFSWMISPLSLLFIVIYKISIWEFSNICESSAVKKRLKFFPCQTICPFIIAIIPLDAIGKKLMSW